MSEGEAGPAQAAFVQSPLRISDPAAEQWDDEVDVAVVGFGAAGASAAIQASDDGAGRVMVLDRFAGGGASKLSGGVVYAGGSEVQAGHGVTDDAEQTRRYLELEARGVVSEATLQRFAEASAGNIEWLAGHGVSFEGELYPKKTSYPPDPYTLYYSGNEVCRPHRDSATPAPRGHRVAGQGQTGGRLFEALRRAVVRRGIEVRQHAEVRRLAIDDGGRVVGLEVWALPRPRGPIARLCRWLERRSDSVIIQEPCIGSPIRGLAERLQRRHARPRRVRARRGVILAAGGFVFNRAMVAEHSPMFLGARPLGANCNGSGILLGQSVDATTAQMDRFSAWRFFTPPDGFMEGVIVDDDGRRLCNEQLYGATVADHMVRLNGGRAWLIIDRTLYDTIRPDARPGRGLPWHQWLPAWLNLHRNCRKAATLEGLAEACGLPPETLARTVREYSETADAGGEDAMGKDAKYLHAFDHGPYFAIDISIDNPVVPCPSLSLGGLAVDEDSGLVRRADGGVIGGLYAAGRNAVGVCSSSYVSGLSLADCVFSGRRAGSHAALGEGATAAGRAAG